MTTIERLAELAEGWRVTIVAKYVQVILIRDDRIVHRYRHDGTPKSLEDAIRRAHNGELGDHA
jgi:hypothetical protein